MPDPGDASLAIAVGLFAASAIVILLAGMRLTTVADILGDRTGLGEAVVGAVLALVPNATTSRLYNAGVRVTQRKRELMDPFPTIIPLATDGSEEAQIASRMATSISESTGSELHLVYVAGTGSPDQAKRFLEAAEDDRLEALYVVAVTTGLRQREQSPPGPSR